MGSITCRYACSVRRVAGLLALSTTVACMGGSCDDSTGSVTPPPVIATVMPCAGLPGETVQLTGSGLGVSTFNIGGTTAPVIGVNNGVVTIRVPNGATGRLLSAFSIGGSTAAAFKVLTGVPVAEVEPNDDVNGANATDTDSERTCSGTLSSAADKDHFSIDCLDNTRSYQITVSPATFGPVYVDGVGIALDAAGVGTIPAGAVSHLVGLTGHTGAYTVTLTPQ